MTETQKMALRLMADRNIGCVYIAGGPNGGWVFPERIRQSNEVAQKVVDKLHK